jgi:pilus assembly protein CpaE
MSEEDKDHTQVLLPGAKIKLFSRNNDTVEVFTKLGKDWRFARVELEVEEGDVDVAANLFAKEESPELVIVETESIDDGFTDKLEELAGNCAEHTSAIVIGPVNDVNLYRKLVGMGVSDYIVRPVKVKQFSNDIAATLLEQIGARDSRLIALIGSKGGVGTTMLSGVLAVGLSEKLGQKTFLMDTAGGWSTLSVAMDFEPSATLSEAIKAAQNDDENVLARMCHTYSDRLSVLGTGIDTMLEESVDPEEIEDLLDILMSTYPALIVDLSASNAELRAKVLTRASEIIVVTTPTLPALRSARTLIQEVSTLRGGKGDELDLIVNMEGFAPKYEVSQSDIKEALDRDPSVVVPFNAELFVGSEGQDLKFTDDKAGVEIVQKLMPLAAKVLSGSHSSELLASVSPADDKKGGIGQLLEKLKAKG